MERRYGRRFDPKGVVVTAGAKQAIFNACFVLFGPGDRVLIGAVLDQLPGAGQTLARSR